MRAWVVLRNGPLARLSRVLASCLLVAGFVYAGWTVLPRAAASGQLYDGSTPDLTAAGPRAIPVFVMRADRSVVRHGTAELESDGRLHVRIFDSAVGKEPSATDALLFRPNLAVLWAAASDASRDELKVRIDAVQDEAARAVERVITSDVFTDVYRPVLRAILTDAVSSAWEDPRTQAALEALLANSEAALERLLHQDLQPILVDRVKDAVWEMLEANWLNSFGVPFGYGLDYAPVLRTISGTLSDPRVQRTLAAFVSQELDTDEARRLAERIVIGTMDALLRDRRAPEVAREMASDPRLRDMMRPFSDAVVALVSATPRHLGGLGTESSLNPLAAHVFRSMVLGQGTPLVLFMTPQDRLRIERLEPDTATFLRPVEAPRRS